MHWWHWLCQWCYHTKVSKKIYFTFQDSFLGSSSGRAHFDRRPRDFHLRPKVFLSPSSAEQHLDSAGGNSLNKNLKHNLEHLHNMHLWKLVCWYSTNLYSLLLCQTIYKQSTVVLTSACIHNSQIEEVEPTDDGQYECQVLSNWFEWNLMGFGRAGSDHSS